jgi:hypothetical protein
MSNEITAPITTSTLNITAPITTPTLNIIAPITLGYAGPIGPIGPTGSSANVMWGLISGSITGQSDLQAQFDTKSDTGHYHDISQITGAGSAATLDSGAFAAASHTHTTGDVVGLTGSLAGKSNTGHQHVLSDITDAGSIASLDSGVFDLAGSAAAAQAYSINRDNHTGIQPISTISGLQGSLDNKLESESDTLDSVVGRGDTTASTITVGGLVDSSLTISELVASDGSKTLVSLPVSTYPSLTELSYVKDVTSSIQSQLDALSSGWVTGTAGTDGNLSKWNADGDLVGSQLLEVRVINHQSSGLIFGGEIIKNALSADQYDISAGNGVIIDNITDPNNPTVYNVSWPALTGNTPTNLATSNITYIAIDQNGDIQEIGTPPTGTSRRLLISLGSVAHTNNTTVDTVTNNPDLYVSPISQLRDIEDAVGIINNGNIITPDGVGLSIDKTVGSLVFNGINYNIDTAEPSKKTYPAVSSPTIRLRTQTGNGASSTTIDVGNYDVNGTITPMTGVNKAGNWRFFLTLSGDIVAQYPQVAYKSLADATQGLQREPFIIYDNLTTSSVLIGVASILANATDLNDETQAAFFNVSKFGELGGAAAGVSTSSLQKAYNNSIEPEILTNSTLGGVTLRRGSAADSDNILEIQNNAGDNVATFDGEGNGTFTGSLSASNLSGTNTGDQDLSVKLNVASPAFTGQQSAPLGTVALPSYTFTGDPDTGGWSPAANTLAWSTGGVERIRLSSAGVGMGTTTPSAKLHTLATTEQLRIGYDASNYANVTVASDGATTLDAAGTGASFVLAKPVTATAQPALNAMGSTHVITKGALESGYGTVYLLRISSDATSSNSTAWVNSLETLSLPAGTYTFESVFIAQTASTTGGINIGPVFSTADSNTCGEVIQTQLSVNGGNATPASFSRFGSNVMQYLLCYAFADQTTSRKVCVGKASGTCVFASTTVFTPRVSQRVTDAANPAYIKTGSYVRFVKIG